MRAGATCDECGWERSLISPSTFLAVDGSANVSAEGSSGGAAFWGAPVGILGGIEGEAEEESTPGDVVRVASFSPHVDEAEGSKDSEPGGGRRTGGVGVISASVCDLAADRSSGRMRPISGSLRRNERFVDGSADTRRSVGLAEGCTADSGGWMIPGRVSSGTREDGAALGSSWTRGICLKRVRGSVV